MHEAIEDFDDMEKFGQGFSSADPLEEIDIGDGSIPRPTFITANLKADQKTKVSPGRSQSGGWTSSARYQSLWEVTSTCSWQSTSSQSGWK